MIQTLLTSEHKPYEMTVHPRTYTARHMARELHLPASRVAKSVVLEADSRYMIAVVRGDETVDLSRARSEIHCGPLRLVNEEELASLFPDCELGAVPPFGSAYGLSTYVDSTVAANDEIVFEGNSHMEAIAMRFQDYEAFEHPRILDMARQA